MKNKILWFAIPILVTVLTFISTENTSHAFTQITMQLEEGIMGPEVANLQTFLASNSIVYPEGLVTGYFGPLTRKAVTQFQIGYGVSAVGRVGPQTLTVINGLIGSGKNINVSAPIISDISVDTSSRSARITWNSNEIVTGKVYYSTSPISIFEATIAKTAPMISGSVAVDLDTDMSKSINLENLDGSTLYYYVVQTIDGDNNITITIPQTLSTS